MKRILFCIENFQHGGITKALENIISLVDKEKYDVGIFVVNQEDGPYKDIFVPYLKYPADKFLNAYCTNYRKYHGIKKLSLLALKFARKTLAKFSYDPFEKLLAKWAKRISNDNFDCVIAFAEGYITNFVSKIKGHKIAWIHIDYKRYLTYSGNPNEKSVYGKYGSIVIPSRFSSASFAETYPELTEKIRIIPNVINCEIVKNKSVETSNLDKRFTTDCFTLVSVGRVCYEKRFFQIPVIARKLKSRGINFKWYIIGDGSEPETATLLMSINSENVTDCVIALGRKDNPYPYIAKSDLLVSTSLSETFSYVVFEAKILGVPVVCADFGTAPEIVNENEGIISTISDMDGRIYELLSDHTRLNQLKCNLRDYRYDNASVLNEIYKSINNI